MRSLLRNDLVAQSCSSWKDDTMTLNAFFISSSSKGGSCTWEHLAWILTGLGVLVYLRQKTSNFPNHPIRSLGDDGKVSNLVSHFKSWFGSSRSTNHADLSVTMATSLQVRESGSLNIPWWRTTTEDENRGQIWQQSTMRAQKHWYN